MIFEDILIEGAKLQGKELIGYSITVGAGLAMIGLTLAILARLSVICFNKMFKKGEDKK